MRIVKKICLSLILILFAGNSLANDSIYVINEGNLHNLKKHLFIYEKSDLKNIENVLESRNRFKRFKIDEYSHQHNDDFWLNFKIKNLSKSEINWVISLGFFHKIEIYQFVEGKLTNKYLAGTKNSSSKFDSILKYGRDHILYLPENKTIEVFIKFSGGSASSLPMNLYSYRSYLKERSQNNMINGLFHGIIIMMILYHLLIYFSVKERSYVFYSLYLLNVSLAFLIPQGYLWPITSGEMATLGWCMIIFIQGIIGFTYLLFLQSFIQTKTTLPRWNKFFNYLKIINIIVVVIAVIMVPIKQSTDISFLMINIGVAVLIFGTLASLIPIYKLKNTISQYFVFGSLILYITALFGFIYLVVFADTSDIQQNIMKTGVIAQMLIFALGLGKKIQLTERDKQEAQLNLIAQLEENQALQTKVNRELEEKVRERTARIRQANEEIMAQRDDLENANTLLEEKNEEILHQKTLLERSHNDIKDSINYASRIQKAVLPKNKEINQFLPEHFILFKPRDVVSGDFYFVKKIGERIVILAADCTGHGVPGAFMSMLGISLLNEIVRKNISGTAADILNQLRIEIKESLSQTGAKGEQQDGMDVALCILELNECRLNYAGAYNPLWLYRNNDEANPGLMEIKADTQPVGIYLKEKPFSNHYLDLKHNDMFYLFSDGFSSQFGGGNSKTYKSKHLKEFLASINNDSATLQKIKLEEEFENWKGDNQQLDDVLIIGVRIKKPNS